MIKSQTQENEFYIDLLFYNYILHCFVAVNLKTGKFLPEYMPNPIGVSEYKLLEEIPEELQATMPRIEEIESRMLGKYRCE